MTSHLDRLQKELQSALLHATAGRHEQTPAGKWSSAQILEHLFLTYKNTARGLTKCLEKGAPLATRATTTQRFATVLLLTTGYFPPGRKSPDRAAPRGMPAEDVRQALFQEIQAMASRLDECERKFGATAKLLDHPVLGPLTAEQWRKFHWIHGRHHAKQIRARTGKA
jgi:hypothetical protein